jgi:putative redox protein
MSEEWKEIFVEWCGENGFLGKNKNGGIVQIGTIDGHPGASPMELLLLGVGGCTALDIVSILKKQRQNLTEFMVEVRGKRAEIHPRVYTDIEIIYHLWGENLESKAVEKAIKLSEDKYCSASAMLRSSARISSKYVLHAPGENYQFLDNDAR